MAHELNNRELKAVNGGFLNPASIPLGVVIAVAKHIESTSSDSSSGSPASE